MKSVQQGRDVPHFILFTDLRSLVLHWKLRTKKNMNNGRTWLTSQLEAKTRRYYLV